MKNFLYNHQEIEAKWQAAWEKADLFQDSARSEALNKLYLLFAFAYPSGSGLHVGHVESKTALDILARYYRMNGRDVFFPVGWDAFGLPAENYAIKTGVPPVVTTKNAIATFERQLKRIGISYDWANEIATCDPDYYRWTQWIFLELYRAGLAYQATGKVNWCPSCQTVLANEQVVNGRCERCGTEVVQKEMKQWFFRITEYKDALIDDLQDVDWPAPTKQQQINWIGRSEGVEVDFVVDQSSAVPTEAAAGSASRTITCFTTRVDTIGGVTFLVLSPEKFKALGLAEIQPEARRQACQDYLMAATKKTEEQRKIGEKDKTGVDTGLTVTNPVTGAQIPVWIADYVLAGYGTGAVMGVPAHDGRDKGFATKFGLEMIKVIEGEQANDYGILINSGKYNGLTSAVALRQIPADFDSFMRPTKNYRLRDWLISRQRYWGAPIPVVYDPSGEPHPVKPEHLPWLLPTDVDFKPTGESPLRSSVEFKERVERLYGPGWTPEYDTMDTFVDSSWYFLRYVDSHNDREFAGSDQLAKWLPVDFYMIGPEHTVLHLLYSRFFTKFLRDQGYLKFSEPFMKMRHQGMILGPDGKKMSKSKGNVINPDDVVEKFGADTLRVYEMFMGPIEADKPWDERSVVGVHRFLRRIYDLVKDADNEKPQPEVVSKLHQTIKKVSSDTPELKFNTAIAAMMEFLNVWEGAGGGIDRSQKLAFVQILAPYAPFVAEELWHIVNTDSVHVSSWPKFDEHLMIEKIVTLGVQVNGKLRAELELTPDEVKTLDQDQVLARVKALANIQKHLEGRSVKKFIYISGRVANLVI